MNPVSWHAQPGTILKLTKEIPLNQGNPIALNLTAVKGDAAIFNEGYWGISVGEGKRYHLVIYLQVRPCGFTINTVIQRLCETFIMTQSDIPHVWGAVGNKVACLSIL